MTAPVTPTAAHFANPDPAELDAYRNGMDQLAWDKPAPGQPVHIRYNRADEPIAWLQHTYRSEPAWCCGSCLRITLGVDPDRCDGCGDADDLTPFVHGPVTCRVIGSYDGPCLIGSSDACHCHEEAYR